MKRTILLTISILLTLSSGLVATLDYESFDYAPYSKKEIKAIKSRFHLAKDQAIFTEQEAEALCDHRLGALVRVLILHKKIKFEEIVDVLDFAREIIDSGFNYKDLEPRIIKNIDQGVVVFTALENAIKRERFHEWHEAVVKRFTEKKDTFVASVDEIALSPREKRRVINVYATCIASFKDDNDRVMMTPEICGARDEFRAPRHLKYPVDIREDHNTEVTSHSTAYNAIMTEAKSVADVYNLSTFERVVMAKCIAEQSLRFFVPSHHPIKALHKNRMLRSKAPEDAFFMRTGVCSNFSGIAYNAALELGLGGKIHLAKTGVHVYLEFEEEGNWYHSHPFNARTKCVITQFESNVPKRP